MRLDGFFSSQGILTRSEAKQEIKKGKVKVNDICIKDPSTTIKEDDIVKYNDQIVGYEEFVYYIINKPENFVCSREDKGGVSVLELIDDNHKDLTTVGRLDKDTTGLLIVTNDGMTVHDLTSPKKHVDKVYYADIKGIVKEEHISMFQNGLDIGDEKITLPAKLKILSVDKENETSKIEVTISEGRYHQVKRMFKAIGCEVETLKRISIGNLNLEEKLEKGKYIKISKEELYKKIYE